MRSENIGFTGRIGPHYVEAGFRADGLHDGFHPAGSGGAVVGIVRFIEIFVKDDFHGIR
jgi:hypothetical protein